MIINRVGLVFQNRGYKIQNQLNKQQYISFTSKPDTFEPSVQQTNEASAEEIEEAKRSAASMKQEAMTEAKKIQKDAESNGKTAIEFYKNGDSMNGVRMAPIKKGKPYDTLELGGEFLFSEGKLFRYIFDRKTNKDTYHYDEKGRLFLACLSEEKRGDSTYTRVTMRYKNNELEMYTKDSNSTKGGLYTSKKRLQLINGQWHYFEGYEKPLGQKATSKIELIQSKNGKWVKA